ncbi:MAG: ParB/RepB/Spo0J family partition protein, partial [Oscillospiraceae bacterium]|nr:ParB/RepB/Spo0J family partition protein [Oscillospiraceae bacterium]
TSSNGPLKVAIQKVEPNPNQPRKEFDPEALQELAESIRQHGLIQPLTVRSRENGFYQIIAGERRWRAARLAGLKQVPVYVVDADDRKVMELALVENLQRTDLNPMEEARGFRSLLEEYGLTQEQVAEQVGKSRPAVANALRLLNLKPSVAKLVEEGKISAGHARALMMLSGERSQMAAAQKIISLELSVRQAESLCRRLAREAKAGDRTEEKIPLQVDYMAECAQNLSRAMGRKVRIAAGKRKGRVEVEYYGLDDLQALYEALMTVRLKKQKEDHTHE